MKTVEEYVSPEQTAEWVETWVRGRAADAGVNGTIAHLLRLSALEVENNKRLREAAKRLADAADAVGIAYFDTDTLDDDVLEMQEATLLVRSALSGEG